MLPNESTHLSKQVLTKLVASYQDLLSYWTGYRMIGSWQTKEFIAEQAANALARLTEYSTALKSKG